ncbi:MAG: UbiA family prenyltransferase, partial [Nitrospinae bacterium]|nr:UbiA family prenyltransferase [Nitrospinota bacterium]
TAGASTPAWMIQRVLDRLRQQMRPRPASPAEKLRGALDAVVISKVSAALGAALMVFANATLGGYAFSWAAAFIAACYIFGMYALNQLSDAQTLKHNEPEKLRFYLRHQRAITAAAGAAVAAALAAAAALGPSAALLYVLALLMGLAYTVKWLPRNETLRVHRLKDIPASKDVFVGVAWVMVTVVVPALASGGGLLEAGVGVAAVFTFTLVYIRSVLSDIRDIHGDRLVGRETIPILIGKTATKFFLGALCAGLAGGLIAAAAAGWVGAFGYVALGAVAYTALYLALYHWRVISRGVAFDLAIDGVFHVTGALALVWIFIA